MIAGGGSPQGWITTISIHERTKNITSIHVTSQQEPRRKQEDSLDLCSTSMLMPLQVSQSSQRRQQLRILLMCSTNQLRANEQWWFISLNADRRLSISILKILSILYDLSGPHRINLVKIASLFYLPIVLKLIFQVSNRPGDPRITWLMTLLMT